MKNNFYIFFSWQSDVPKNRNFIDSKIKAAVKEIKAMPEMAGVEIDYDHSTQNRSGSPDIVRTIHEKINKCDVFIADVTPITPINTWSKVARYWRRIKVDGEKLIPNPNVMTEAGFALRAIGEQRIILLSRSDKGNIEDLPFDIRHRRVTPFPNLDNAEEKRNFSLTPMILTAIKYSRSYKAEEHQDKEVQHDTNIFKGLTLAVGDESRFLETVSNVASNVRISRAELELFDAITNYIDKPENQFLIPELKSDALSLRDGIKAMTTVTGTYFTPSCKHWEQIKPGMTPVEICEANHNSFYDWDHSCLDYKTHQKKEAAIIDGLGAAYDRIRKTYAQLRQEIKRNLFI